jgi:hypothetical protein
MLVFSANKRNIHMYASCIWEGFDCNRYEAGMDATRHIHGTAGEIPSHS